LTIDGLLDSNVVIAMLVQVHQHHEQSARLLDGSNRMRFAVAAHSYAEAYVTLTRRGERAPFRFAPRDAWTALEGLRAATSLVGPTPAQAVDAVGNFARDGGIGARLYDRLIGEAALAHSIPAIVTWNVRHMRSLFPGLTVISPADLGAAGSA
jgi:predicted nucleic acid-binding protein